MKKNDNEQFLTEQIITYLGNKRSLLDFIGEAIEKIQKDCEKQKLTIVDIFSGSGIVARYLKKYSDTLITNDLEDYSYTINKCYLANKSELDMDRLAKYYNLLTEKLSKRLYGGFISEMYAPLDTDNIKAGERVFFTTRNANYIDTCRKIIETFPDDIKPFFIAPLLSEASIKNNTGGVFKGFYKNKKGIGQYGGQGENALARIKADINIPLPVFSDFECNVVNYKKDANELAKELINIDVVYIDPPYNQHPYGSNYFMLNLINNYKKPNKVSQVSGIPNDWNRSNYNKKREALNSMEDLCKKLKTKYLLISYNSEGFITKEEMIEMLNKIGKVEVLEKQYNTYRASRNLNGRSLYVNEILFIVKK
ncbi:MAG: DNA modification methylase [Lachnospiraceae bacterium]|jgi:adenine-specific DNA-methyltransferase|nr:DNA modification methylase [Lachnospiraceae bacterium]